MSRQSILLSEPIPAKKATGGCLEASGHRDKDGYCNTRGGAIGISRLTEMKVAEVRRRFTQGQLQTAIAKLYGVSQSTVSDIVTRKTWRHV